MTTNKMTYVTALTLALETLTAENANAEMLEKLTALRETLMKKSERKTTSDKPSKKAEENAPLAEKVRELLAKCPLTCKELAEQMDLTSSKVLGVLRTMNDVESKEGKTKSAPKVWNLKK